MLTTNNYRLLFPGRVAMPVIKYDTTKINLAGWARAVFGVADLQYLHQLPDPEHFPTYVERLFYRVSQLKQQAAQIREACTRLKEEVIIPLFGEMEQFQFPPSFRCHLAGARTASAFHRDDTTYGVMPNTLNIWLPLTPVYGNNSIHIETEPGLANYQPVEMQPGELLIFDAHRLSHGSRTNTTPVTRVSIDIRFRPKDISRAKEMGLYAVSA